MNIESLPINLKGEKVNSKTYFQECIETDSLNSNTVIYEGKITLLFSPWLVDNIPDRAWQTLQEKLCNIIREICRKNQINKRVSV